MATTVVRKYLTQATICVSFPMDPLRTATGVCGRAIALEAFEDKRPSQEFVVLSLAGPGRCRVGRSVIN